MNSLEEELKNEHIRQAFDAMAQKDFQKAEQELQKGLTLAQEKQDEGLIALFYSSLGVLFKVQKDFQKAWKYYDQAERLLPDNPALKLIAAQLLIEIFSQYEAALRRCEKVLQLAPSDPALVHQAYATMGLATLKSGQRQAAIKYLNQAMDHDFEGLGSPGMIDLKLVEALLKKQTGLTECHCYLQKALGFSKQYEDEAFINLFTQLLEAFPQEETKPEKE